MASPFILANVRTNPQADYVEDYQTPFSDYLGAKTEDAWDASVPHSLGTMQDLESAEKGAPGPAYSPRMFALTGEDRYNERLAPTTALLDQSAAMARVKDAGLDGRLTIPAEGLRAGTLDILIEHKREELARSDAIARAPNRYAWAGVPASIAVGVLDPVNVAASFIPVVGEARWAAVLARTEGQAFARAGYRAARGLAEGAVGSAAVEPVIYAAKQAEQADYGAMDSLLNITFGSILGGGLHVVGGYAFDRFSQHARAENSRIANEARRELGLPEVPRETVEPSPAAWEAYRAPDEGVAARLEGERPATIDAARQMALERLRSDLTAEALPDVSQRAERGAVPALREELATIERQLAGLDADQRAAAKSFNEQPGVTRKQAERMARDATEERRADLQGRRERIASELERNRTGAAAEQDLAAIARGEVPERFAGRVEAEAKRLMGPVVRPLTAAIRDVIPAAVIVQRLSPQTREAVTRTAIAQAMSGREIDVNAVAALDPRGPKGVEPIHELAQRTAREDAGSGPPKAEKQMEPMDEVEQQTKDELARIKESLRGAELPKVEAEALAEAEAMVGNTERYKKAARAAAACLLRH